MNFKTLFSSIDQIKVLQGIEGKLRRRRKGGIVATIATVLVGLFELIRELSKQEHISDYLSKVATSTGDVINYLWHLITFQWASLLNYDIAYDVLGFYLIILAGIIYFISRHTSFLLKTSKEPFQYTFWIDRFERVDVAGKEPYKPTEDSDISHLLHHDLMDMLNKRIGRFSLLEEKNFTNGTNPNKTPSSHIHVDGHYTIREVAKDKKVVQVMPRVRIGPPGNPTILTYPVEIEVKKEEQRGKLTHDTYGQVLEQVYSKVASEIYKQLRSEIKQKIHLFPTNYLRAVALYHEAEDFSRSNTIDAYDHAIELYKDALRYYDISLRVQLTRKLLPFRTIRLGVELQLMWARTVIGYSKCLIYRRQVSSLTGRTKNALFEVPAEIEKVIDRLIRIHNKFSWKLAIKPAEKEEDDITYLEKARTKARYELTLSSLTFEKDTWQNRRLKFKPDIKKYGKVRKLLFDAYVVLALAYGNLGATKKAKENLKTAQATYPEGYGTNSLFLLAQAEAKLSLELKIPLLVQATELAPYFEIPQYLLAKYMQFKFLSKGEIYKIRAKPLIKEFKKVLKINPGNIASYASLGYIYWLINDLDNAKKHFEQGIKTKAIVQQTFVGELNYGLARISARNGEFNKCYDLYNEALSAEPGIGAYSIDFSGGGKAVTTSFYDYITESVVSRYSDFKKSFEEQTLQAVVRLYEKDLLDPKGLISELDKGLGHSSEYLRSELFRSSNSGEKKDATPILTKEILKKLNELLSKPEYGDSLLANDKSVAKTVEKARKKAKFDEEIEATVKHSNRLILEALYPKFIRESGKYTAAKLVPKREVSESDGKLITINALNKSYSYVLNDYGNACLNHFHRHGSLKLLDEAIKVYEQAIEHDPKNAIAYYNVANAIMWRHHYKRDPEDAEKRKQYLERADEFMPSPWSNVIISTVQQQMRDIDKSIRSQQDEIDEDKGNLNRIEQEIRGLHDEIQAWDPTMKGKTHTAYSSQSAGSGGHTPLDKLEYDVDTKEKAKHKIEAKLPMKKEDLARSKREYNNKLISGIKRTVKLSKLYPIIEGLGFDTSGSCVEKFTKVEIARDRVDEKDIEAIIGWAELLTINPLDSQALEAAVKLCHYALDYHAQLFTINNILHNALLKLEDFEIEGMLKNHSIVSLLYSDDIKRILWDTEIEALGKKPPEEILNLPKYYLDSIKTKFRSPYFKIKEIREPESILKVLLYLWDEALIDYNLDGLHQLQDKLIKNEIQEGDLRLELLKVLNRLLIVNFYTELFHNRANFSEKTRQIAEFELSKKLKGFDLIRFNRRVLQEVIQKGIKRSDIEITRDNLSETIKFDWLGSDPIHFLALEEWAGGFLIFPELEQCTRNAIKQNSPTVKSYHKVLADLYEKAEYAESSIKNYENALVVYKKEGIYHIRLSRSLTKKERFEEAKQLISKARKKNILKPDESDIEVKYILIGEARFLVKLTKFDQAIIKYKKALNLLPTDDNDNLNKELQKVEKQALKHDIKIHHGDKWADQPLVVTPIAMEVASNLIPLVEGEKTGESLSESLLTLVAEMRERVHDNFGVRIPGIRFRGNETDLAEGTYIIMINEVPLVMGTISLHERLFTGEKKEIEALGIQFKEVHDPLYGKEAFWIDDKDVGKLESHNGKLWEVFEYPMRHLENVLRRNLIDFLGHQEVSNLIEEKLPERSELYATSPEKLIDLTSVLRGLISEKVPLVELKTVIDYFEGHFYEGMNLTDMINEIRLLPEIRKNLPGNLNKANFKQLGPQMELEFENATYNENGKYVLAMVPKNCQDVLSAIRNGISGSENSTIVVNNKQLRPLVRQLLKLEFPNTPVFTRDEMTSDYMNGSNNIEVIDL